jgi:tRNA (guanine-N1)-methyltransferase
LLCAKHQSLPDVHSIEPWVHAVHLGDYVISGGGLAAVGVIDAVSRQILGGVGNQDSFNDSFADGWVDYPHYTISLIIQKISTIFLVNRGVFYGYFALLLLCAKHQSLPDVHSINLKHSPCYAGVMKV